MPTKKITGYVSGANGCDYYRILSPFKYLDPTKFTAQYKTIMEPKDFDCMDIMVLGRADSFEVYQNMFVAIENGIKVVYEFDDLFHEVPEYNPAFEYYNHPFLKPNIEMFIQNSNAVTVSTEYLKEYYSKYNSNIHVLPNSIDFTLWNKFEKSRSSDIVIGWAGSPTHSKDLDLVVEALVEILKSNPKVKLNAVGYNFLNDERFKEVGYQLKFASHLDVYNFPRLLTDFTIGIAPIVDNPFNNGKSNIKFLEYSALKIPTIASNVGPYKCIQDGITGLLCNTKEEWISGLQSLIDNPSIVQDLGQLAYDYVYENFNMAKTAQKWEKLYNSL